MTSLEVIEERLKNLSEDLHTWKGELKDQMCTEFGIIKTKQDKTNGRVTSLEYWRYWSIGFGACFTLILIPLAFMVFGKFI